MRVGDVLRDLDARFLPPLARRLHGLTARFAGLRLLAPVAALSAAAVVATAVWTADRAPLAGRRGAQVVRVGVVEGQSLPGYLGASRDELDALVADPSPQVAAERVYALVTLTAYLAPERLAPVLDGLTVSEVYTRVPLSGVPSPVVRLAAYRVPGDVVTGMLDTARRRDREGAEYLALREMVTGPDEPHQRLRLAYEGAARVAAAEATAYRAGCSCVFAAVVRATPAALARLSGRREVRVVDPAPEVRSLERAEFRPPLPEDAATAPAAGSQPSMAAGPGTPVGPAASAGPSAGIGASAAPGASAPVPTAGTASAGAGSPGGPAPASPSDPTGDPAPSADPESSVTAPTSSGASTGPSAGVPSSEPASPVGTASP